MEQKIKQLLGELMFNNVALGLRIEELEAQLKDKDAKQL